MEGIAILTTFRDFDEVYSLCGVVRDQIKMLVTHGYKPKVLVTEGFKPTEVYTEDLLCHLPDQNRANTASVDETFNEDVQKLLEAYRVHLKDVKIIITHDIVYQTDALKHNVALRLYQKEREDLRFLHWIHSATSPLALAELRPYFKEEYKKVAQNMFPYSYYIFFNDWSVPRIAREYGVGKELVKVVHHPTDYMEYAKFDEDTKDFVKKHSLLDVDYLIIYPARLDTGKQLEYPIKLIGTLKKMRYNAKFVAVDFHSTSDDPKDPKYIYRKKLKDVAREWGADILFTSEERPEWKAGVPRSVVSDLTRLSNVFFMSSASESYSLVTQEAAMDGNLLITNQNFPPFIDIFGQGVLEFPCTSNLNILDRTDGETKTQFNEQEAYDELAKLVIVNTQFHKQETTRRMLLQTRNPDYIFERELEPLFRDVLDRKWQFNFEKDD